MVVPDFHTSYSELNLSGSVFVPNHCSDMFSSFSLSLSVNSILYIQWSLPCADSQ